VTTHSDKLAALAGDRWHSLTALRAKLHASPQSVSAALTRLRQQGYTVEKRRMPQSPLSFEYRITPTTH
jgi:biotin operon repressor